jgi:hypothetical protein
VPCDELQIGGVTFTGVRVLADEPSGPYKGIDIFGQGPWRRVSYYVEDGAQTDAFCDALAGTLTWIGLGGPITYPDPHRYPGNTNLVAMNIGCVRVGAVLDESKLIRGMGDKVNVAYGVPVWDVAGDRDDQAFGNQAEKYAADSTRGYTAEYSAPAGIFQDEDSNLYERSRPVKVPEIAMIRHKAYVPYMVDEILKDLVGKVNDAPFWGKERGTLLFEDWDDSPSIVDARGNRVRLVSLSLRWRPYDWNAVIAPDPPYRWVILDDGSGGYANEYADLTPLISIGV